MISSSTWPSLSKGMTIAYGHDGSGLYLPHVDPSEPWQFARSHGRGFKFHDISGFKPLTKATKVPTDELMSLDRAVMHNEMRWMISDSYFPSNLALGYSYESNNIASNVGFDPTIGSLIDIGRIGDENDAKLAMAYADGSNYNMACIGSLVDEVTEIMGSDQTVLGSLTIPRLDGISRIDLKSPVKQIQLAEPEPTVSPFLLCRTVVGTSLVPVRWSHDQAQFTQKLDIFSRQNSHVHSQFNNWNWNEVGIVSSDASYGVWQLNETEIVNSYQSKLPDHLLSRSNWGKLLFQGSNELLVGNRRGIFTADTRNSRHTSLIEIPAEKTAFQLHDFVQSPTNSDHLFAMTTDHLSWLDCRMPGKSLLSWKHYLSPDDPSWRLNVSAIDEINEVSVYSQVVPARIVYQFTEENGLPKSADDPYYLSCPAEAVVQSIISTELESTGNDERFTAAYFMSTDHVLYRQIACTDGDCQLPTEEHDTTDDDISESDDIYGYEKRPGIHAPATVYYYDFRRFYKYLFEQDLPGSGTMDDLQEYATQLSETIGENFNKSKLRAIRTLLETCKPIELPDNSENTSDMIEQLSTHYKDTKIQVFPLTFSLKSLFDETTIDNMSKLSSYLSSLWLDPISDRQDLTTDLKARRHQLCKHIAMEMILACTGVHFHGEKARNKPDYLQILEQYIDKPLTKAPSRKGTQLLLDEWDDGPIEEYRWRKLGQPRSEPENTVSVDPFAHLSQSTRPTPSRSSQVKRKKKRNEGFT